ncbi:MAG: hypothetical protein Q8P67_28880, partial [archaeon]|nr:hypothetical protein [archaeon]
MMDPPDSPEEPVGTAQVATLQESLDRLALQLTSFKQMLLLEESAALHSSRRQQGFQAAASPLALTRCGISDEQIELLVASSVGVSSQLSELSSLLGASYEAEPPLRSLAISDSPAKGVSRPPSSRPASGSFFGEFGNFSIDLISSLRSGKLLSG